MAGAGFRTFVAGQVLTAAQVQNYLQDQSIQVYPTAAARSSAIGTVASAGMYSYRTDEKALEFYTGSVWELADQNQNAGKNKVINGAFDFWQRGTSFSNFANDTYTVDRWRNFYDGTGAATSISQQTHSPGSAPSGASNPYFLRYAVTTAGSSNTYRFLDHRIEDVRTFAGQTVTLSFWAKADSARTVSASLIQNFGSGGSADVSAGSTNFSVTTSWQRFSATVSLSSISGKTIGSGSFLYMRISLPAGVIMSVDLDEVQLEAGSVATPFSRAGGTIQGELAACQRYYYRNTPGTAYGMYSLGVAWATTAIGCVMPLPVTMRTVPSMETSSAATFRIGNGNTNVSVNSSPGIDGTYSNTNTVYFNAGVASGLTTGNSYWIGNNNNTSAYLGFSAEL